MDNDIRQNDKRRSNETKEWKQVAPRSLSARRRGVVVKLVGARRIFRRAPMISISRPVSRVLSARATPSRDGHSSATSVTRRLQQPTRTAGSGHGSRGSLRSRGQAPRRPYSVLLPVGFAVPLALPQARCALTAPFHPYRSPSAWRKRRSVLCGTFPGLHTRRTLSGTVCPWSPDFPLGPPFGLGPSGRPADWQL